jgi:hypothetical protein
MDMKQTAIEWLENQQEIQDMINIYSCDAQLFLRMVFNKAKQMEKEQIKDSFNESRLTNPMIGFKHNNFEQYYNETYNVKDN